MKKLLTILFFFICLKSVSQTWPITTNIGSKPTLVQTFGAFGTQTGIVWISDYIDTATANISAYVKYTPGTVIRTGTSFWVRNNAATAWVAIGAGGGGGGFTSANNGLTAASSTLIQLGGALVQNTTVSGLNNTYSVTFDSINTFAIKRNNLNRFSVGSSQTLIQSINNNSIISMTAGNVTIGTSSLGAIDLFSQWTDMNGNGGVVSLQDSVSIRPGSSQILKIYPLLNKADLTNLTLMSYDTTDASVYHTSVATIAAATPTLYNANGTTNGARSVNLGGALTWAGHNTRAVLYDSVSSFTVTRNNVTRLSIGTTGTTLFANNTNNALSLLTGSIVLGSSLTGAATVQSQSTSITGTGGQVNLFDSIAIRPGASQVLHIYPLLNNTNSTTRTVVTYDTTDGSVYHTPMSSIVGATPTLQQVFDIESQNAALTAFNNTITSSHTLTLALDTFTATANRISLTTSGNRGFFVNQTGAFDFVLITAGSQGTPTGSQGLNINGLVGSHNATDSMMVIDASTGYVGYRPIPSSSSGTVTSVATGLGLSGGTITTTGTIIADTTYLLNKSTQQVITGSKIFNNATTFFTPTTTTGSTTSSGLVVTANALTSGTAEYISSSSQTFGILSNLASTSTVKVTGNALSVHTSSGANGTASVTNVGDSISIINTGTTSTNIAMKPLASGATVNWAILTGSANNGDGRVNINNATNDANHTLIVKSIDNTGAHGIKLLANNETASATIAWDGIAGSADYKVTASTGNVTLNTLSTKGVGVNVTPTSTLHVNGSIATAYVAKTANYTATLTDFTINCTANTFTVTLPASTSIIGRIYYIVNSGAGTITIATTGGETFLNVTAVPTTLTMATVGTTAVQSTGGGWVRLSSL